FPERQLDGVDDFLHARALEESALVPASLVEDLADERADQVRIEQRPPRLTRAASGRIEPRGHLDVAELDLVLRRPLEGLAEAVLLHQPADDRALAPVDARFEPRVVPNSDEAGLHGAQRAVLELPQEDVT